MTPEVLSMFERVFGAMEALGRLDDAVLARCEALTTENACLWDANAELRDEVHALAEVHRQAHIGEFSPHTIGGSSG